MTTARLPTNDRTWLALGATWRWSDRGQLDAALAHTFLDDTDIDRLGDTGERLIGTFEAESTILSLGLVYQF